MIRVVKDKLRLRKRVRRNRPSNGLPLNRVRLLDLTHVWSGPHAARLLADWGAEVIKIEYCQRMDSTRGWLKRFRLYNLTPHHLQLDRNKRSITLDLKESRAKKVFEELIKVSDVVIENFRAGFMASLGLDYNHLKHINPEIILVSMPGFGSTGPEKSCPAYGASLEAVSGLQSLTSYGKGERPRRLKELDMFVGLQGASAVMTALFYRQRTGKGQWVDLSQLESVLTALIGEHLLEYEMNGNQTLPIGNHHPSFAPYGCYRCRGDDKWVVIAVRTDEEWEKFCASVKHPEWKNDERFCNTESRLKSLNQLDILIENWTIKNTHYQAMQCLQEAGIAAGAVLNVKEVCSDPHINQRQFIRTEKEAGKGGLRFPGIPFKVSGENGDVFWRGPCLGDDNEYVLCEILGIPLTELGSFQCGKIGTAYDSEEG